MNDRPKIIAVDFDGTLAADAWPDIGAPIQSVIDALKVEQAARCKTVLWTNRTGEKLEAAVAWCAAQGIALDAVNENLPHMIEFFGGDTRKIFANEYWDDRARLMPERTCHVDVQASEWDKNEWPSRCECGHEWLSLFNIDEHCPGCGARIVKWWGD